jgi:serine/threonine protein kinase
LWLCTDPSIAFRYVIQVLRAAHEKGVTHGDVSPDNIIVVGDDSRPHLIDWGSASSSGDDDFGFRGKWHAVMLARARRPFSDCGQDSLGVIHYLHDLTFPL